VRHSAESTWVFQKRWLSRNNISIRGEPTAVASAAMDDDEEAIDVVGFRERGLEADQQTADSGF
jgi:hypothetical protein